MTKARQRGAAQSALVVKVRRGIWWGVLGGVGQQFASVLTTVVLVRLLVPSEFGVVVAANVVVAMAGLFTFLGIRLAIVRVPDLDETMLWTLFWMSTALGVVTSALCVGLASLAAAAMGQAAATPFLRVLGALILVQTLSGVPRALLQRDMRFRAVYSVELGAVAAQSVSAIAAALSGLGAWSLVVGYAAQSVVLLVGYWGVVRRVPRLIFDRAKAREQLRFGAGMWTNTMLVYVVRNADFWAVSRALGSATLGVYYVAYVLPNVLRQRLTWVTSEVMMPSFASMQDDLPRLRAIYQRSLRLHASVGLPAMAGLAVVSPIVVDVFFGSRWAAAATPMALVCLAAAVEFLTQPAINLLVALGRTGTLVGIQLGRAVVLVPGVFLVAGRGGLVSVALVVLSSSVLTAVHAQIVCAHRTQGRLRPLLLTTLPALVASGGMASAVLGLGQILPASQTPLVSLPLLITLGAVSYPALLFLVAPRFSRSLFSDLRLLVSRRSGGSNQPA